MSVTPDRITASEFARRDGCNEKLVRRAIERGKLIRDADGLMDAAQVGTPWRKSAIDGKKPRRPGEMPNSAEVTTKFVTSPAAVATSSPSAAPAPRPATGLAEDPGPAISPGDAPVPGMVSAYNNSLAREKAAQARLRELELAKREGQLVDVEAARGLFFGAFRAVRDHWLALPSAHSAMIAARLDIEPDLVHDVLVEFIRKHGAKLVAPAFDLRGGA